MSRLVIEFPGPITREMAEALKAQLAALPEDEWKSIVTANGGVVRDLDVPSVLTDEDVDRIARRVIDYIEGRAA